MIHLLFLFKKIRNLLHVTTQQSTIQSAISLLRFSPIPESETLCDFETQCILILEEYRSQCHRALDMSIESIKDRYYTLVTYCCCYHQ